MKHSWRGLALGGTVFNVALMGALALFIRPAAYADNKTGTTGNAGGVPICDCSKPSGQCGCTFS